MKWSVKKSAALPGEDIPDKKAGMAWYMELPTPAAEEDFSAVMQVMSILREMPDERLCIWFPHAPELLMEIRHCAGGYLVKERTDLAPGETFEEALKKVRFQYFHESLDEVEGMLRSFCCGEDALVTVESPLRGSAFRLYVQTPDKEPVQAICF